MILKKKKVTIILIIKTEVSQSSKQAKIVHVEHQNSLIMNYAFHIAFYVTIITFFSISHTQIQNKKGKDGK